MSTLFEQGNAIRYEEREIPLEEVTYALMCDSKSHFPIGYDFEQLPLETQGACMLAPLELERLLGLKDKSFFARIYDALFVK
jgi:hypothetical protein